MYTNEQIRTWKASKIAELGPFIYDDAVAEQRRIENDCEYRAYVQIDDDTYTGECSRGTTNLEGHGIYRFEDGDVLEGYWHDDELNGKGRVIYTDGIIIIIEGVFKDG